MRLEALRSRRREIEIGSDAMPHVGLQATTEVPERVPAQIDSVDNDRVTLVVPVIEPVDVGGARRVSLHSGHGTSPIFRTHHSDISVGSRERDQRLDITRNEKIGVARGIVPFDQARRLLPVSMQKLLGRPRSE
jgi:hypothetical protein